MANALPPLACSVLHFTPPASRRPSNFDEPIKNTLENKFALSMRIEIEKRNLKNV